MPSWVFAGKRSYQAGLSSAVLPCADVGAIYSVSSAVFFRAIFVVKNKKGIKHGNLFLPRTGESEFG